MKDIREGDLHKTVVVEDTVFEIRYGYTSEEERGRWDPVPLYPDFVKIPMFTPDGFPFATVYQDGCRHFREKPLSSGERWCGDCKHFEQCEEYIAHRKTGAFPENVGSRPDTPLRTESRPV